MAESVTTRLVAEAAKMDCSINNMNLICSDYKQRIALADEKCQALNHSLSEETVKVDCAETNLASLRALVESQSNVASLLEGRLLNLIQALNNRREKTEADRKKYERQMQKYSDLWDSYLVIYNKFPLAEERRKLQNKNKLLEILINQERRATLVAESQMETRDQIQGQLLEALGRKYNTLRFQVNSLEAKLENVRVTQSKKQEELERAMSHRSEKQLQERQLSLLGAPKIGSNASTISTPVRQAFKRAFQSSSQSLQQTPPQLSSQPQRLSQFRGAAPQLQDNRNVYVSFNRREISARIVEETCSVLLPAPQSQNTNASNTYVDTFGGDTADQLHKKARLTHYSSSENDDTFSGSGSPREEVRSMWDANPARACSTLISRLPSLQTGPPLQASTRTESPFMSTASSQPRGPRNNYLAASGPITSTASMAVVQPQPLPSPVGLATSSAPPCTFQCNVSPATANGPSLQTAHNITKPGANLTAVFSSSAARPQPSLPPPVSTTTFPTPALMSQSCAPPPGTRLPQDLSPPSLPTAPSQDHHAQPGAPAMETAATSDMSLQSSGSSQTPPPTRRFHVPQATPSAQGGPTTRVDQSADIAGLSQHVNDPCNKEKSHSMPLNNGDKSHYFQQIPSNLEESDCGAGGKEAAEMANQRTDVPYAQDESRSEGSQDLFNTQQPADASSMGDTSFSPHPPFADDIQSSPPSFACEFQSPPLLLSVSPPPQDHGPGTGFDLTSGFGFSLSGGPRGLFGLGSGSTETNKADKTNAPQSNEAFQFGFNKAPSASIFSLFKK